MGWLKEAYYSDPVPPNKFSIKNKIALGINTGKGNGTGKRVITMPENVATALISTSRYGKSVLLKRIYSYSFGYFHNRKAGIIFDMQGDDHRLSAKPNSNAKPLFYEDGEQPFGFKNVINYAPTFTSEEMHPQDKLFGFSIGDCNSRDVNSLHLTRASNQTIFDALNDPDFKITGLKSLKQAIQWKVENASMAGAIMRNINTWREDKLFCDTNSKHYRQSFVDHLKDKKILVFNFHQSTEYSPLYIGLILRDIYTKIRDDRRHNRKEFGDLLVVVEEADLCLPKDDRSLLQGSNKWLTECLRRGGKYGIKTIISTQQASDLNKSVKNHIQQWVIGNLVGDDIKFFKEFLSEEIMEALKNINRAPNSWGAREWIIVYDRNNFDTFVPFNSPVEIHRA